MAYVKTTWVNGTTKLNATNMNHIEDGIADLDTGKAASSELTAETNARIAADTDLSDDLGDLTEKVNGFFSFDAATGTLTITNT